MMMGNYQIEIVASVGWHSDFSLLSFVARRHIALCAAVRCKLRG